MKRLMSSIWTPWLIFALVLLVLPWFFTNNFALSLLTQIGIVILACLSFNILLGQGGMLSFGHAVYTGLGAYVAIHAMNLASQQVLPIPVMLIPLVGGLGGMFFAVLFGYVSTRKSGTTFAMITLGLSELVFAMSLMLADFFGGEAGIAGNRVYGQPWLGLTFGPQKQVYYLIAVYVFVCVGLIYAFTQTPLGRILNAVRDNPERVEFIGYNTQRVTWHSSWRASLRVWQVAWLRSTTKSSPPKWWVRCDQARICCSPFWGARVCFMAPSLVVLCSSWRMCCSLKSRKHGCCIWA